MEQPDKVLSCVANYPPARPFWMHVLEQIFYAHRLGERANLLDRLSQDKTTKVLRLLERVHVLHYKITKLIELFRSN
jgi:hypothetical protein